MRVTNLEIAKIRVEDNRKMRETPQMSRNMALQEVPAKATSTYKQSKTPLPNMAMAQTSKYGTQFDTWKRHKHEA